MSTYKTPRYPDILAPRQWENASELNEDLRDDKSCRRQLSGIVEAWERVNFDQLEQFLSEQPAWPRYNAEEWASRCDQLCRDIIVKGVMDLREVIKNATLSIEKTAAKTLDKKDKNSAKSFAYVRRLVEEADDLTKALLPEKIEKLIRAHESEVNALMLAKANLPLAGIAKNIGVLKTVLALLIKKPSASAYNALATATKGPLAELIQCLKFLAALPDRGFHYPKSAAEIARNLEALKPFPEGAPPAEILAALKTLLQEIASASKLPKVKI
jgi:hypothetical protein